MSQVGNNGSTLLSIKDLKVHFPIEKTLLDKLFSGGKVRYVHAVDGVDLELNEGMTLGLVGESGSGKSSLGLSIIGLVRLTTGSITFRNQNISHLSKKDRRGIHHHIQMVFQDPFSSLNPSMKVREIVGRQFKVSDVSYNSKEIQEMLEGIITSVGLKKEDLSKYPHEFSGGQKQRISLARALAPQPELLIADEITSALDVSIQSQIISLLLKFKETSNLAMIYITHDLRVARLITDFISVMYVGRIVEQGKTPDIFNKPLHPYTKALLTAIPRNRYQERVALVGSLPSAVDKPIGCALFDRCPYRMVRCKEVYPPLTEVGEDRLVACHLYTEKPHV